MSSATAKLVLIEKPRNFKERENNRMYYQQKFFSKKQKDDLKETQRKQAIAKAIIGIRQEFGQCGQLYSRAAGGSKFAEKEAWKYHAESMKVVYEKYHKPSSTPEPTPEPTPETVEDDPVVQHEEHEEPVVPVLNVLNIHPTEVVDSWEDLC
jgi:hypothetical protein